MKDRPEFRKGTAEDGPRRARKRYPGDVAYVFVRIAMSLVIVVVALEEFVHHLPGPGAAVLVILAMDYAGIVTIVAVGRAGLVVDLVTRALMLAGYLALGFWVFNPGFWVIVAEMAYLALRLLRVLGR